MECPFCHTIVADVDEAIAADWLPGYFEGEHEVDEAVCSACVERYLREDDGEFVIRELAPMGVDEY